MELPDDWSNTGSQLAFDAKFSRSLSSAMSRACVDSAGFADSILGIACNEPRIAVLRFPLLATPGRNRRRARQQLAVGPMAQLAPASRQTHPSSEHVRSDGGDSSGYDV